MSHVRIVSPRPYSSLAQRKSAWFGTRRRRLKSYRRNHLKQNPTIHLVCMPWSTNKATQLLNKIWVVLMYRKPWADLDTVPMLHTMPYGAQCHDEPRIMTEARHRNRNHSQMLQSCQGLCRAFADVAELADATDSKSVGLITRVGSSPTIGTSVTWSDQLCDTKKWDTYSN